MDNSDRILEFITKNEGTTELKISKYMRGDNRQKHYCARQTTRDIIFKLLKEGKIIDRNKKEGKGFHHLFYVNDKNKFTQIYDELLKVETFVNDTNQRLRRILEDRLIEQDELRKRHHEVRYQDEDESKKQELGTEQEDLDKLATYFGNLEFLYVDSLTKLLDRYYLKIPRANLSQADFESLAKKMLEVKSKVHYYRWKDDYDRALFETQISKIEQWEEYMQKDKFLKDFFEKKNVGADLTSPLKDMLRSMTET